MEGLLQKGMASAMGGGQPPQPMASPAAMAGDQAGDAPNVTGEEQKEYERGMAAVMQVIHGDEKGQRAIIGRLDPQNAVGSVAETSANVIFTVDEKIDLNENVIMPLLEELVPLVAEIGQKSKKIQISPKEIEQALATATELVLDNYGVDEEGYAEAAAGVDGAQAEQTYINTLNGGEGAANVQQ